jgi:pimeloyl-ACP methyl ester carboxylesterase
VSSSPPRALSLQAQGLGARAATANELWPCADGTRLVGHRFGGKRPGTRPQSSSPTSRTVTSASGRPTRGASREGHFVLAFDLRGHGASKGRQEYGRLGLDVAAAVRAVRGLGTRKVVVVGASLGGIAGVVGAASARPPVAGLVAVSAPAEIAGRLNALPSAARLAVPTLYLAAGAGPERAVRLRGRRAEAVRRDRHREKKVEVVPGSLHGVALVAGSARVRGLLEAFVRDPSGTVP